MTIDTSFFDILLHRFTHNFQTLKMCEKQKKKSHTQENEMCNDVMYVKKTTLFPFTFQIMHKT